MPADFNTVQEALKPLKVGDRVVLKIIYQGSFVTLWGTLKTKAPTATMITDDEVIVAIRPLVMFNGRNYEFSSLGRG